MSQYSLGKAGGTCSVPYIATCTSVWLFLTSPSCKCLCERDERPGPMLTEQYGAAGCGSYISFENVSHESRHQRSLLSQSFAKKPSLSPANTKLKPPTLSPIFLKKPVSGASMCECQEPSQFCSALYPGGLSTQKYEHPKLPSIFPSL